MPFTIVRQDITKMKVDAIVNAANTELLMGGGVCGAIFNATGAKELQEACDKKSPIKTGDAVITPGFKLPAKFVIHAAGPVYNHNNKGKSAALLSSAYINSLPRRVRCGICGGFTSACCVLCTQNTCCGRRAAFGRIPHRPAQPSGAICC